MKAVSLIFYGTLCLTLLGCAPKVKIVHFWSTWCSTCAVELDELKKFAAANADSSIQIEAVAAFDRKDAVDKFLKSREFPFPIIVDTNDALARQYGISEVPTTVILDGRGRPLEIFDPVHRIYSSKLEGARSWASDLMCRSLEDAVKR